MKICRGVYRRGNRIWICYVDPYGRTIREPSRSGDAEYAKHLVEQRRSSVKDGTYHEIVKDRINTLIPVYIRVVHSRLSSIGIHPNFIRKDVGIKDAVRLLKAVNNIISHMEVGRK